MLGQLLAGFAIAQRPAVIGELWEHFHGIARAAADDRHADQRAARRPRQFRRRQPAPRTAGRTIPPATPPRAGGRSKRERQRGAGLKPLDDLDKGKTVLADDQRLDPATPPQRDAQLGQAVVGFGLGEDRQRDAQLGQQQTAMLPIAEVERDEERCRVRVGGRRE